MKDITKNYSNGEVTIVWKPSLFAFIPGIVSMAWGRYFTRRSSHGLRSNMQRQIRL